MAWSDVTDTAETWNGVLKTDIHAMLDDSSNELNDHLGNVLVWGAIDAWTDAMANSETWTDV